jgi:hypothetical protein
MTEARRDDLNELLAVLTREIGLEPLSFAEDGYCALGVESGRIIHLQQEGDDLVLMAELGDLPRGPDRLAKAELLLRANAFGMGTNGATLGLAADTDALLLTRREPIDRLLEQGLAGSLGDFVEAAERWARAMTADTEAPVAESSNVASAPDPGSFV